MKDEPSTALIQAGTIRPEDFGNHIMRRLSSMKGQYLHQGAYDDMLAHEDTLLYEVYELLRPEKEGELLSGLSIVHPGTVGGEYFMTKGHFHQVLDTAEVYLCLSGKGLMVMETPEGEWSVKELSPGVSLYVPPRWAHRSVNVGSTEDLVTYFIYPAHAGHDYGTIETRGFRKLVVEGESGPEIIDNPKWSEAAV